MPYEITHIRLSENDKTGTEKISHVKLSAGTVETVPQVVQYIDQGMNYFYTTSSYSRAEVESVKPMFSDPYIRTKQNRTTSDNLLNLPSF